MARAFRRHFGATPSNLRATASSSRTRRVDAGLSPLHLAGGNRARDGLIRQLR